METIKSLYEVVIELLKTVAGLAVGFIVVTTVAVTIWYILRVTAYWRLFTKAGKPGWISVIPIINLCEQYAISWKGIWGLIYLVFIGAGGYLAAEDPEALTWRVALSSVLLLAAFVIRVIGMHKLSRAFDHGVFYTLFLYLFGTVAMMVLGLGKSKYIGKS